LGVDSAPTHRGAMVSGLQGAQSPEAGARLLLAVHDAHKRTSHGPRRESVAGGIGSLAARLSAAIVFPRGEDTLREISLETRTFGPSIFFNTRSSVLLRKVIVAVNFENIDRIIGRKE
jgi:hypothetical protein